MPHKLASTFTSFVFNRALRVLVADDLDNFDLRLIQPNGIIDARCRRIKDNVPGDAVTGQASEIESDPFAFHVEMTQKISPKISIVYEGIAIVNSRDEVTSILGFRKKVTTRTGRGPKRLAEQVVQDETTWVVTKP